ncbi:MAG: UDP-N-acetylmuramoyl-L-alanyl-D-glutamate--2,6-diaminopimelate ligase [Acidimicrobiales bacterium]|jgi:UDP-N-acetylmuramoyl-L-alanyl-D-glutamate--2,6-diaminopimelate ligase
MNEDGIATANSTAASVDAVLLGDGSVALRGATHDSRSVGADTLFCCIRGGNFDGHAFAAAAVDAGAVALLVDHELAQSEVGNVTQLVVPDVRKALGPASVEIYDHPSEKLDVVGVTGTNGKTTIVHLLETLLSRDGSSVKIFGTLTGARTTPEAPELQAQLADAARRGVDAVAMEVSSHALDMRRIDGTRFRIAIFTNLGHDHLDHHGTIESYYQAKARLFSPTLADLAIINVDDPAGQRLARETDLDEVITYGLSDAKDLSIDGPISRFTWRGLPVTLQLAGGYNVSNALAAALAAEALGREPEDIADALCAVSPPRGRFEFVNIGQPFHVAVDYAHTPDALVAALTAARQVAGDAKVSVVFGCGGDRDRQKRPEMGRAAVAGADRVYVTSDNPRSEDPTEIVNAILDGIPGGAAHIATTVELERDVAIAKAIGEARPGDVVLIAGKGHETEQIIGGTVSPFDDRAVALRALGTLS